MIKCYVHIMIPYNDQFRYDSLHYKLRWHNWLISYLFWCWNTCSCYSIRGCSFTSDSTLSFWKNKRLGVCTLNPFLCHVKSFPLLLRRFQTYIFVFLNPILCKISSAITTCNQIISRFGGEYGLSCFRWWCLKIKRKVFYKVKINEKLYIQFTYYSNTL